MAYSLLLIDDQILVRLGITEMVQGSALTVVAEVDHKAAALTSISQQTTDLVVMESRLAGLDALDILQQIKADFPRLPVVVFSAFNHPIQVAQSNTLGASGYLLKSMPSTEFVDSCLRAIRGEYLWTSDDLRRISTSLSTPKLGPAIEVPLSQREVQILELMCMGATNKEIALQLGIGYETVKEYVQKVLRKLHVADRTQAAVWAIRKGLF